MIFPIGGLAQLARAFGWQPKGHRFDSDILHNNRGKDEMILTSLFFIPVLSILIYL